MNVENIQAQMRKGILEYCVLSILSKNECYPSDIIKQLKEVELIIVEGTLYPLLTRLKNGEILDYRWEESASGPPRKYYSLTPKGMQFLKNLKETWGLLNNAVQLLENKEL